MRTYVDRQDPSAEREVGFRGAHGAARAEHARAVSEDRDRLTQGAGRSEAREARGSRCAGPDQ